MQLLIHATAGARRCSVGGRRDGGLKVTVNAVAEKGKANVAITKVLAKALGLRPAQIELIRGHASRRKLVVIHDPPPDLQGKIEQLMNQD